MNEDMTGLPVPSGSSEPPGLYLVATPIGNLRDITLRALDVLAAADLVLCEDTRVTGKLLNVYGIKTKMLPYNDHSAAAQRDMVLERLRAGGRVALVSDAGTPLVSDPGYKLVRDVIDQGLAVTALPGANAPLTALQLSGLPSDKFSFLGFLPPKSEARRKILQDWQSVRAPLIVFESGPRLTETLRDMAAIWGDRPAALVRELTKLYEETRRESLAGLHDYYQEHGPPRGEIVLVIAGAREQAPDERDLRAMTAQALETMSVRDAASTVAGATGQPRKKIYQMALALAAEGSEKHGGNNGDDQ